VSGHVIQFSSYSLVALALTYASQFDVNYFSVLYCCWLI